MIIVEGIADAVFINDLIGTILPKDEAKFEETVQFQRGKKIQTSIYRDINIFVAGGCTSIRKYNKQIAGFNDEGYKVIMLQDADSEEKDNHHGGVTKRIKYLNEIKAEFKIEFEVFLFPNNLTDGTLETILLSISADELYNKFFKCYEGYSNCVKEINSVNSKELLEEKYLIYNYCQVYQGNEMSSERDRRYVSEFWNLDHSNLQPLKEFLISELDI
ncbi:MAG: DUF3226 domain-containing protein [Cyclobacteriaceae bacterium]